MGSIAVPLSKSLSAAEALAPAQQISVSSVSMRFATDRSDMLALDNVSLDIRKGEFVCLLGPSGCGKSTLLNIIAGFLRPSTGVVSIDGEPVNAPDPRRMFVFQERGVFPWLTVAGNIGFGLSRLPPAERQQRVQHYLKLVGLERFADAYPQALSGGMKQRVEVARALAVNPDILFMDEPFGALDSITRFDLRRELLRIWAEEKKTVLFVTHDIEEAVQLAQRVVVMTARPGKIGHIVDVDLPYPRDLTHPHYLELRNRLLNDLGLAHGG